MVMLFHMFFGMFVWIPNPFHFVSPLWFFCVF